MAATFYPEHYTVLRTLPSQYMALVIDIIPKNHHSALVNVLIMRTYRHKSWTPGKGDMTPPKH